MGRFIYVGATQHINVPATGISCYAFRSRTTLIIRQCSEVIGDDKGVRELRRRSFYRTLNMLPARGCATSKKPAAQSVRRQLVGAIPRRVGLILFACVLFCGTVVKTPSTRTGGCSLVLNGNAGTTLTPVCSITSNLTCRHVQQGTHLTVDINNRGHIKHVNPNTVHQCRNVNSPTLRTTLASTKLSRGFYFTAVVSLTCRMPVYVRRIVSRCTSLPNVTSLHRRVLNPIHRGYGHALSLVGTSVN